MIELLVVVAIIGILAAVGIPIFQGYVKDAKIAAVQKNFDEFVNFMQIQMISCDMSDTIKLHTSNGWNNVQCPNDAWQMAWALTSHFEYEDWKMLYPEEWYSKWSLYAVHVSNDPAGKRVCPAMNAGYICIGMVRGKSEEINVWSVTSNDSSLSNRVLRKTIQWKR